MKYLLVLFLSLLTSTLFGQHHSSRSYHFHSSIPSSHSYKSYHSTRTGSPSYYKRSYTRKRPYSFHTYPRTPSTRSYHSYTTRRTSSPSYSKRSYTPKPYYPRRSYAYGVTRDAHGRIKRNESAKRAFMRQSGYPHGRPGYVVDHIIPLKRGGCDCPGNMQWQTKEAAKAKDKVE